MKLINDRRKKYLLIYDVLKKSDKLVNPFCFFKVAW